MDQHQQENSGSCQQRCLKMYHENYLTCLQKISSEARGFETGIDNHLFPKLNQKLKELLGRVIDQIICVSELIKTFLEPVSDHTDTYYKIFLAIRLLLLILWKSNLEVQVDRIMIFYQIFLDLIKYWLKNPINYAVTSPRHHHTSSTQNNVHIKAQRSLLLCFCCVYW